MATHNSDAESAATGASTWLFVGLVWLGAAIYTTNATITGSGENLAEVLGAALAALPGVVAAALVAGASVGAAIGGRFRNARGRLRAGLVMGTLFGLASAAGIRFAYGGEASIVVLAAIVAAASILGGGLAVLPSQVLVAGLRATTWVFALGVILGFLQPHVVKVLGGGESARTEFLVGQSLATGLTAAFGTLRSLRPEGNRVWYLVCGALPGLVLLAAELLTRVGGSAVARLAHGSRVYSPVPALSDSARLRHALIVLAVGALLGLFTGALRRLLSRARRQRQRAAMDAFHQDLARIGLDAGEPFGFALAGGYAVHVAGLGKRPIEDVDLFTAWERRGDFVTASRAIAETYTMAGLSVTADHRHDNFTQLSVSNGVLTAKVDLGVDSRANEPIRTPIGPVLHPDDAIANKMRALYERSKASDFVDIDAVLLSGRYDRSTLLRLAGRADITFDRRVFADALGQAQLLDADAFAPYALVGEKLDSLRRRFASWREELLNTDTPIG